MCGIIGQFSKHLNINKSAAENMQQAIAHRGPDDKGSYFENNVFLGHNRLSILDLSPKGRQPMWDSFQSAGIVFNGEIYNFKEIRQELSEYSFKSETDTEVIIYAYKKWGLRKTLEKLNGMFAFCIYDKQKQKAYFARDRAGIKPLVYYWDGENFIFASEIKALLKSDIIKAQIEPEAVYNYFIYRYIGYPKTIFKNIYKLSPGHFATLDLKSFKLNDDTYWNLTDSRSIHKPEKVLLEEIEELLKSSVSMRLIADTEVAAFLSGGIDSSLITKLASLEKPDIKAFTINLQPEKYSEAKYARLHAHKHKIRLEEQIVGKEEFKQYFNTIIKCYDEPFADSSAIPTWLLCKFVSDSGIKCALSGDGGDELFYGYSWYYTAEKLQKYSFIKKLLPKAVIQLFEKFPILKPISYLAFDSLERYRRIMLNRYTSDEVNAMFNFNDIYPETHFYKQLLGKSSLKNSEMNWLDFHSFLTNDILYKVDIAAMANSLEVRIPFLDHRLTELMFSLSFKLLYQNSSLKYLLKKTAARHIDNENIHRKKKGFSAPVMNWVNKNFIEEIKNGSFIKSDMANADYINKLLQTEKNNGKIWQLYIFEKWFTNYFSSHNNTSSRHY